jgi:hypothetical protein
MRATGVDLAVKLRVAACISMFADTACRLTAVDQQELPKSWNGTRALLLATIVELSSFDLTHDHHQSAGCNLGCSSPPSDPVQPSTRLLADLRRERP